MNEAPLILSPDWALPPGVQAFVTTRQGGYSQSPWSNFNLALHVGDDAAHAGANRDLLHQTLQRGGVRNPFCIQWLQQVHGCAVYEAHLPCQNFPSPQADALYTRQRGIVCAVLTADCVPVLFCAEDGSEIAAAHAGWRGLLGGVLEQTLARFRSPSAGIHAWLGPGIGPCHFEVGAEVREAFIQAAGQQREATLAAFTAGPDAPAGQARRYYADLYQLARLRLAAIASVSGGDACTVCEPERWYSHRNAAPTGRFASGILRT